MGKTKTITIQKMRDNFNTIQTSGRLLYKYIRGSQLYNTQLEDGKSDIDTGGVFIAPFEDSIGTHIHYQEQISSSKGDDVLYELEVYGRMLGTSNSTVLESLFIPDDKILVKPHKCLEGFFANKDKFITQRCFKPFTAFAIAQVKKCTGLNKLINWDIKERLTPLDFCYTFKGQGSTKITNWLEYRAMHQEYCGLVAIPNMIGAYGVFYDWGRQFADENITLEQLLLYYFSSPLNTASIVDEMKNTDGDKEELQARLHHSHLQNMVRSIEHAYNITNEDDFRKWFYNVSVVHKYRGITSDLSTDLRLSPVVKGEKPICHLVYNEYGYRKHCSDYKKFKEWEKNRNPVRYESNLEKSYDSKNMYHFFRLVQMGIEIANGEGINPVRTYDREFLLDVRHHKYEYDEIVEMAKAKEEELNQAFKNTKLPAKLDIDMINDLVIEAKKSFFNIS